MSDFKFGDLVSHEVHGLGVVSLGSIFFEDGDVYAKCIAPSGLEVFSRHQKWVKFDIAAQETWPTHGFDYLVLIDSVEKCAAFFDNGIWRAPAAVCGMDLEFSGDVTHWMPLPEPPKETL